MPATKSEKLQLLYEGSVKRVYASPKHEDRLWFQFTDDYSVFDWGKMPDTIANKGRALTVIGAFFFQQLVEPTFWRQLKTSKYLPALEKEWLERAFKSPVYERFCQKGLFTHFTRLCDDGGNTLDLPDAATTSASVFMEVEGASVFRPEPAVVNDQPVYLYPQPSSRQVRRLVPLEVVFRFGMPAGSSLKERLDKNPDYARQIGLKRVPEANAMFDRPVLEFFTKLEPKDRLLTLSEALNISTLTADQFNVMVETATLTALAVAALFGKEGVELWDGKFEFTCNETEVFLADSIGPDELRLIYKGLQLSKESIRQVYRGTPWESALKQAQKLAAERGVETWKAICKDELKQQPEPLFAAFKRNIDSLYPVLANHVAGESLFANQPTLEQLAQAFKTEKK